MSPTRMRPLARGLRAAAGMLVTATMLSGLLVDPAAGAAGTGSTLSIYGGNDTFTAITPGPATSSSLYYPRRLASDASGNIYFSFNSGSPDQRSVAKIDSSGQLSYLLNANRTDGVSEAGPATTSPFGLVSDVAADGSGNVYVVDASNRVAVKVDTSGQLTRFAGTGVRSDGPLVNGTATDVNMWPNAVATGPSGSVYLSDRGTAQMSKIVGGQLTVVAGNGSGGIPTPGTSGSPVAATSSPFGASANNGLAVDASGNLFISDSSNSCILMVAAGSGNLTAVAGTCDTNGTPDNGPAASQLLGTPSQMAVDRYGSLYVVDQRFFKILKITDPASGTGTMSVIAGTGGSGNLTPGPALSSPTRKVTGITVDRSLNVFLSEGGNGYVGKISSTPSVPDPPAGLTSSAGNASVTLTVTAPADDGGSPVTGYEYTTDAGATWLALTTTGTGTLTGTISGLTNATAYTIAVRALNVVGPGAASPTTRATPVSPPPPVPPTGPPPPTSAPTGRVTVPAGSRPGTDGLPRVVVATTKGSMTVRCALSGRTTTVACTVQLLARVSDRWVVVGRATRRGGTASSLGVRVHLTSAGRALAARPGGFRARVRATMTEAGASVRIPASTTVRVVARQVLVPRPVLFSTASAWVHADDAHYLARLRTKLAGVRVVTCIGYTDSRSGRAYNHRLGHRRAVAACRLLTHGLKVKVQRVTRGEVRPFASNLNLRGRALNRRTEILLRY